MNSGIISLVAQADNGSYKIFWRVYHPQINLKEFLKHHILEGHRSLDDVWWSFGARSGLVSPLDVRLS